MSDRDPWNRPDDRPATAGELAALAARLEEMHNLTCERIKEVRADVAGGVELHDINSGEVLNRIGTLLGQVTARPSPTDVGGPGQEIEAVIRLNGEAANRIMDAAEHISEQIENAAIPQELRSTILNDISAIFEACGFQDLTGQRIQRALKTLRSIEVSMLGRRTADAAADDKIGQAYVDSVFADPVRAGCNENGQADIDALFA
jgi:chemotaxis protein CheZ